MLLYIFGLDASSGTLNYTCNNSNANTNSISGVTVDALGNVIIYDPEYNAVTNPVLYQSPNIIIPNPNNNDNTHDESNDNNNGNNTFEECNDNQVATIM